MPRLVALLTISHRYSTIWIARGIPADGKIITLELEQKHADVRIRPFHAMTRSF